jgi:hypothetical protein
MGSRNFSAFLLPGFFVAYLCCPQLAFGDTAPCDLLTQNQVSGVVGTSVGAGSPIASTGCSWQAAGKSKVTVTVSMQSEKMFAGAKTGAAPNMTKTSISGIGDEAIFIGVGNFCSLWVRKGTKFLLVRIYGLPVSEAQTKLKTLATSAVSNL